MTKVQDIVMEQLEIKRDQVTPEALIVEDLCADSLDVMEISMKLEETFGFTIDDEKLERSSPWTTSTKRWAACCGLGDQFNLLSSGRGSGYCPAPMKNAGTFVLSEIVSPATIQLNLKSANRDLVLEELVNSIPELAQQPESRQILLKALYEREQLHSTGIGDGIALPHARNALVGLVDHAIIVFGRHPVGIDYRAIDGFRPGCFSS